MLNKIEVFVIKPVLILYLLKTALTILLLRVSNLEMNKKWTKGNQIKCIWSNVMCNISGQKEVIKNLCAGWKYNYTNEIFKRGDIVHRPVIQWNPGCAWTY